MAEDTRLATVVVDDDLLVVKGGFDEAGQNHAVLAGLAGAYGVEEANCGDFKALGFVQGVGDSLFESFGVGVGPADFLRGTDYAI